VRSTVRTCCWLEGLGPFGFRDIHDVRQRPGEWSELGSRDMDCIGRMVMRPRERERMSHYNLFRYCHNDPLDLTDPMGLSPFEPSGPERHVVTGSHIAVSDKDLLAAKEALGQSTTGARAAMSSEGLHSSDRLTGVASRSAEMQAKLEAHLAAMKQTANGFDEKVTPMLELVETVVVMAMPGPKGGKVAGLGATKIENAAQAIEKWLAARQAAKEAFRREAAGFERRVLRDRNTNRIKGVGAGDATYRPKLDGRYSVDPQYGRRGTDTLHFPDDGP
jgi:hypothetical protein